MFNLRYDPYAYDIVQALKEEGFLGYYVGGCVRDALMNIQPKDIDICTDALPAEVMNILKSLGMKCLDTHVKYGTVIAMAEGNEYEITTFRRDGKYEDARHPDCVRFVSDLEEDLSRRDFTMNAIAYDPTNGEIIDPFGGEDAIAAGVIECVGHPPMRFREDGLRILRALRFAIKYNFEIGDRTALAMRWNRLQLNKISKERITEELKKMLTCGKPVRQVFLDYSDIICTVLPEMRPCVGFDQNNKHHRHDVYEHILYVVDGCETEDFNIKLAALLHDIGKPAKYTVDEEGNGHFYGHPEVSADITSQILEKRLRLSNDDAAEVWRLVALHDIRPVTTDGGVRRILGKLTPETFDKWFVLKYSDIADHVGSSSFYDGLPDMYAIGKRLIAEEGQFKIKDLDVTGHDIMNVTGLPEGREIGDILKALFEMVVDDAVPNENERLIEIVKSQYA